jgi:hypothetical protein
MFKHLILSLCAVTITTSIYAKDADPMTPPKPVENKVLDSMVGTWQSESDMMGVKMKDTLNISWALNHQFLKTELSAQAIDNPNIRYDGLGLFGVDKNNHLKTWWFGNWGASSVSTGTGTTQNNQLVLKDGNAEFKQERTFRISANEMIMDVKGTMTKDGKEVPFEQHVVYKKQ